MSIENIKIGLKKLNKTVNIPTSHKDAFELSVDVWISTHNITFLLSFFKYIIVISHTLNISKTLFFVLQLSEKCF